MLNWRTITGSNDPKRFVRGTELESCIPDGFRSRFAIYSVRTVSFGEKNALGERPAEYDAKFVVRDAETISDAQVKEGVRPEIFGQYATLDDALAAIEPYRVIDDAMWDDEFEEAA